MENEQQDDGIPEEVMSIIDLIETTFYKKRYSYVLPALWLILIKAIMADEECSVLEAVESARNFCDDAIADNPWH
jgi:hypothetical protein